jgi:hypothetical protein
MSGTIAVSNVAQPIIPRSVHPAAQFAVQGLIPFNNGSNNMYIGDSLVTPTNGLTLYPSGSLAAFPPLTYSMDLREFHIYGTAGDIYSVMIFP